MDSYLLLRALHLVAMVAWFAGLFYLPRLLVYTVEHPHAANTLHLMSRKLSHLIMAPAACATWVLGVMLLMQTPHYAQSGWMHTKLALVVVLTAYHLSLEVMRRQILAGSCRLTGRFLRIYNEVPTLLLIAIVMLAVFKPF